MKEGQPQSFKEKAIREIKNTAESAYGVARIYSPRNFPRIAWELGKLALKRELPVSSVLTAGEIALFSAAVYKGDPALVIFSGLYLATAPLAGIMENSARNVTYENEDRQEEPNPREDRQNGFA